MASFYEQTGDNEFDSTALTAGPWSPKAQHGGPPSALLTRAIERHEPREGHRLGRVCVDILRPVPVAPLQVSVRSVHTGKRIQLIEATAQSEGKAVLIARAWRLLAVPGTVPSTPQTIGEDFADIPVSHEVDLQWANMDGYMSVIDWRIEKGRFDQWGPAKVWARQTVPLLEDEEPSPWQRAVTVADSGSGVSLCLDPSRFPAVNCDLNVVMHRDPVSEWIMLDSQTTISAGAGALASTVLADRRGPVGSATQTLLASTT